MLSVLHAVHRSCGILKQVQDDFSFITYHAEERSICPRAIPTKRDDEQILSYATYDVLDFEACGPVSLSLSKTRAERPLPAILRQAQDDSHFCYVIFSFRGHRILKLWMTKRVS
jgi:hypothetical protein